MTKNKRMLLISDKKKPSVDQKRSPQTKEEAQGNKITFDQKKREIKSQR